MPDWVRQGELCGWWAFRPLSLPPEGSQSCQCFASFVRHRENLHPPQGPQQLHTQAASTQRILMDLLAGAGARGTQNSGPSVPTTRLRGAGVYSICPEGLPLCA